MNATEHDIQITEEPCIKINKNGEEDPSISFAINIKNTGR